MWNKIVSYHETNCLLEKIVLHQECDDCATISPMGSLGKAKNQMVLSHVTVVWNNQRPAAEKDCELKKFTRAGGFYSKTKKIRWVGYEMNLIN